MEAKIQNKKRNSINTLSPYRIDDNLWVYDDEDLGVYKEAFVMGSSEVINMLVGMECRKFTMHISASPIPKYEAMLTKIEGDGTPGWYKLEGTDMEHWLCEQCCQYFKEGYPPNIFVKISNKK